MVTTYNENDMISFANFAAEQCLINEKGEVLKGDFLNWKYIQNLEKSRGFLEKQRIIDGIVLGWYSINKVETIQMVFANPEIYFESVIDDEVYISEKLNRNELQELPEEELTSTVIKCLDKFYSDLKNNKLWPKKIEEAMVMQNYLSEFIEFCENETGINIPDEVYVSFLDKE